MTVQLPIYLHLSLSSISDYWFAPRTHFHRNMSLCLALSNEVSGNNKTYAAVLPNNPKNPTLNMHNMENSTHTRDATDRPLDLRKETYFVTMLLGR